MKRIVSLSVVFISAALFISACSKDDSPVTPPASQSKASDYWPPTGANNTLTLEGSVKVTSSGVVVGETPLVTEMKSLGGTATTADGKQVIPYRSIDISDNDPDTTYFWAYLSDAVVLNYHALGTGADIDTMIKAPIAVGTSWSSNNSNDGRYTIMAVNETVSTPAGTFSNCVRMRSSSTDPATGATSELQIWVAKGVGPVKMSGLSDTSIGGVTMRVETSVLLKSKNF